ncbi:hypothetical protein [Zavarzinia compransoris]|nr:hypothetical protein [Zavarzinia compransoris]TDP44516.1 hypothetical protein DES42_107284 [Zavarzinia compransoris]
MFIRPPDDFTQARRQLTKFLLGYSLTESYYAFMLARKAYPFIAKANIVPGTALPRTEHRHQRTAFVILLEQPLPRALIRHFRVRKSNRVTPQNLAGLCPGVTADNFDPLTLRPSEPDSKALLRRLMPIDYAVLAEPQAAQGPITLSHVHVKIERLTDNAIRELAAELGYIERRLFERGEDYADALEAKYYEYYGFPGNASGRKSAAAMAAQMLGKTGMRFTVLLANQDDCRITILDEGETITQYMVMRLDREGEEQLHQAAAAAGVEDLGAYTLATDERGSAIVIYRVDFVRAAPARGRGRSDADRLLRQPWLEIAREWVVKVPTVDQDNLDDALDTLFDLDRGHLDALPEELPITWARRRSPLTSG